MLPKYKIDYSLPFRKQTTPNHYQTDEPVAAEEFLCELLERGFRILTIHHEGVPLSPADSDRLIKRAASMLAANHIKASLNISTEEERFRFGFSA